MSAEDRGAHRRAADLVGTVLWTLLKVAFVLGVLAVLGFIALGIWLRQQFPEPRGVPAPMAWTSHEVVLSTQSGALEGRLTLTTAPGRSAGARTVGVNAGVPRRAAGALAGEPGDIISLPAARLTATTVGESASTRSCLAPCELEMPVSFVCTATDCQMAVDVTVELLAAGAGESGDVMIGIAGGLMAFAESVVLDGLVVNLAIGGSVAPEAT